MRLLKILRLYESSMIGWRKGQDSEGGMECHYVLGGGVKAVENGTPSEPVVYISEQGGDFKDNSV